MRCGKGGERMRRLGLGFSNPVRIWGISFNLSLRYSLFYDIQSLELTSLFIDL